MNLTPFEGTKPSQKNIRSVERESIGTTGTHAGRLEGLQGHMQGKGGDSKDTTAHSAALLASESACHNANLKTTSALKKQAG